MIGTTGNQWARITVPSKDVMLQSVFDPGTGEATTEGVRTGRLQDTVVAAPAMVVVGDEEEDVHPVNDPAMTTADTSATKADRKMAEGLPMGRSASEDDIGGVLHHSTRLAIHHWPRAHPPFYLKCTI